MRLSDDITISLAGKDIVLRPALRHAIRLERRDGSFGKLMQDVAEESLSVACELLGDHVKMTPHMREAALAALPVLKFPLVAYVGALTGIDPDDLPSDGQAKAKPVTLAEHLAGLYRIGTGWLGWTPAHTLDATPAEIREAYRGRLDFLQAIFGGEAEPKAPATPDQLAAKMKFIFGARAKQAEA